MKKITEPATKEVAVFYSDFSGKCFGEIPPPIEINISFGYGSKYDGTEIKLHIDDEDANNLLELIKRSVSEEFKLNTKKIIACYEKNYEDAMQMRDWDYCDTTSNTIWFWKHFLNLTNEDEEVE